MNGTMAKWLHVELYPLVVYVAIVLCLQPVQGECPDNFELHDKSCYLVVSQPATWIDAQSYCSIVGARLAEPNEEEENLFLKEQAARIESACTWIGVTDFAREGTWLLASRGQKASYLPWTLGQPDNSQTEGAGENCACLLRSSGYSWNDAACHLRKEFICEVKDLQYSSVLNLPPAFEELNLRG